MFKKNNKDIRDYLNDILDSINNINEFIYDLSNEDFYKDKKTSLAINKVF